MISLDQYGKIRPSLEILSFWYGDTIKLGTPGHEDFPCRGVIKARNISNQVKNNIDVGNRNRDCDNDFMNRTKLYRFAYLILMLQTV